MFKPYFKLGRFHSLSGAFYLLMPCWWGLALALPDVVVQGNGQGNGGGNADGKFWTLVLLPAVLLAVLFAVAAVAARAAGSAWNDLLDCDIDKKTARTRTRPLPQGDLSKRQALLFVLLALFVCGVCLLGLLALAANPVLLLLLVCAVLPVAAFYPLAKRVLFAPQVVLGIAFNWGILCASAALAGSVSSSALILWLGSVAWTTFYDSIYAWQDIEDDRRTKMKSLTLWLDKKRHPKLWLAALYAFFLACLLFALVQLSFVQTGEEARGAFGIGMGTWLAGFFAGFFSFPLPLFFLLSLLLLALWCYADLARCNLRKAQDCMAFFRKEWWRTGGGILLLLLLATQI